MSTHNICLWRNKKISILLDWKSFLWRSMAHMHAQTLHTDTFFWWNITPYFVVLLHNTDILLLYSLGWNLINFIRSPLWTFKTSLHFCPASLCLTAFELKLLIPSATTSCDLCLSSLFCCGIVLRMLCVFTGIYPFSIVLIFMAIPLS